MVLLLLPLHVFGQQDSTEFYTNTLKTNVLSPWTNYQTLSVSYERYLDRRRIIEYEALYHIGVTDLVEKTSLSYIKPDLQGFSGGLNVIFKKHNKEDNPFYWGYEGGYQFYNFENSHTVCTEVDVTQEAICPCLSFEENVFQRKINQISGAFRLGWQTPISRYYKRFRVDFFMSSGFRVAFGKDIGRLEHVFCDTELETNYNRAALAKEGLFRSGVDKKESTFAPYFLIGLKLGYAF